jgi:3-hydroxyacyl-CoA dehydrogenase
VPSAVRRAVAEGALGLNASRGFYDYRGCSTEALLRERDRRLLLWLRERERYRLDHRRLEMEG